MVPVSDYERLVGKPHLTLFELPKNILCLAINPIIRTEPRIDADLH